MLQRIGVLLTNVLNSNSPLVRGVIELGWDELLSRAYQLVIFSVFCRLALPIPAVEREILHDLLHTPLPRWLKCCLATIFYLAILAIVCRFVLRLEDLMLH